MEVMGQAKFRKKITANELVAFFQIIHGYHPVRNDLVFLCIGSDRSIGDSLGPFVGTLLQEAGYDNVIGTLQDPCDASNLLNRMENLDANKVVVAIDAGLGQPSSVGLYQVSNQPIQPGKSVGKNLLQVGDYSIAAMVNSSGSNMYSILQNTSLHRVRKMAKEIAHSIQAVYQ